MGAGAFFARETLASAFGTQRGLDILFSVPEERWQRKLSQGFAGTRHRVTFADLGAVDVAQYDLVVPLLLEHVRWVRERGVELPGNLIPIPTLDAIELCDDKRAFNDRLSELGFGGMVPAMGSGLRFPYVVKKRRDHGSNHVRLVRDAADASSSAHLTDDPDYFCQAYVRGAREYATHAIVRDGRIQCSLTVEYAYPTDTPIKLVDAVDYHRLCRCPYLDDFETVLRAIGFEGLCCINYKVDEGGVRLLEVNPRLGGSLLRFFFVFVRQLQRASR